MHIRITQIKVEGLSLSKERVTVVDTAERAFTGGMPNEDSPQMRTSSPTSLVVRECVPEASFIGRAVPYRTAQVRTAREALSLRWIAKLPGEKKIRIIHGQMFVIQDYAGSKLIRAHICHGEEHGPALTRIQ